MRSWFLFSVLAAGLTLAGCNAEGDHRREPVARQAGRDAYKLKQEGKRAAKELGRDLKNAGREARQGWNQAQREDQGAHRKKQDSREHP
ncbi:MAG: hypothetical protein LAQ30_27645 [Acidobacteriia bacterium]|nr:hypothetical protein [Terriglobia bacterium]